MIVYEKRAPLPLPFFSQWSNSEVHSNYTNIFSLVKGKIIFKYVNPCLLYDTHMQFSCIWQYIYTKWSKYL